MTSSAPKIKLYYTPTSCGAASYIVAFAGNVDFDSEQVDLASHKTASGEDFYKINPKGNVPALIVRENGQEYLLNEGSAVLQYLADHGSNPSLAHKYGTKERYEVMNALNYIASEVHVNIGGRFNKSASEDWRNAMAERAYKKFDYLTSNNLANGRKFLVGDNFTIADSYLYIVLSWTQWVGITMDNHPVIKAYYERVKGLDFVQKAHEKMNAAKKS